MSPASEATEVVQQLLALLSAGDTLRADGLPGMLSAARVPEDALIPAEAENTAAAAAN